MVGTALLLHDAEEDALELPRDEFECSTRDSGSRIRGDNQLVHAEQVQAMQGWLGDRIAVNGA